MDEKDKLQHQEDLKFAVHRAFTELTERGMEANEACALALKIASGITEMPMSLEAYLRTIDRAETSKSAAAYEEASQHTRKFFGNTDALDAAFWADMDTVAAPAAAAAGAAALAGGAAGAAPGEGAAGSECAPTVGKPPGVDFVTLQQVYDRLVALQQECITAALHQAMVALVDAMQRQQPTSLLLRQLAILLANPQLEDVEQHGIVADVAAMVARLPVETRAAAVEMFASYSVAEMTRVVVTLQQYLTLTLYTEQGVITGIEHTTQLLSLLSQANDKSGVLNFTMFYNDAVNNEDFNLKEDYRRWKLQQRFSFCQHPFLFDPAAKATILGLDNYQEQQQEFDTALFRSLLGDGACPYLLLRVRRGEHLVQDTLTQINRAKAAGSLKKPLKVKFLGEEGVDEGGVQKEFFQLLVRQLFNPDYGMFAYDEETRLYWFRPSQLDLSMEYELVGILIGLAIYNSHILEFQFPMVLYQKLMGGWVPRLGDLRELHPAVHRSLIKLLEHEGPDDVADWGLSFQVEMEVGFGDVETVDLLPNGGQVAVTRANREQYVQLYASHLLERSIQKQFDSFNKGFKQLCTGPVLKFFRPQELELLICGGRELDLEALEQATLYDDTYSRNARVVRWFWEIVHSFTEPQKKRLLSFITGSDRVPIKGLGHLSPPFVIARNGDHSDRLPTAHTCFNHLLLPQYDSKAALEHRLLLAIENAEGFGLM